MEELSEAPQLCRVLRFAGQHEADREFTVNELIDPTATSLVTVARLRSDDDVRSGYVDHFFSNLPT